MTLVRVQVPFLPERRDLLERTCAAFHDQEGVDVEVITLTGMSWGRAHNSMLASVHDDVVDYVLLGSDDAVPRPGAVRAAVDFHVETGDLPGCRFLENDLPLDPSYDAKPHGEETNWCRLFCAPPSVYREIGRFLDLTWYTDIDYCQRLREHAYRIRMVDGFTFDHLDAPRTWASDGEVERQHRVYRQACAIANRSPLA